MTGACTKILDSLSVQFFEMVPVRRLHWQNADIAVDDLDEEAQRYILSSTVNSKLCHDCPPSIQYQRTFVKKLLTMLEGCGVEICDELYETYTQLLQHRDLEEETLCYKTYTLDKDTRITIQESVNMISSGTTGLSTWQAAQHLAEWAVQNKKLLENRNILELGCGLGLTGITVCKVCCVNVYTFTDCHPQVLDCLARNIQQNFRENKLTKTQHKRIEEAEHKLDDKQSDGVKYDRTLCDQYRSCDTVTRPDCDTDNSVSNCDTIESAVDCASGDPRIHCDTKLGHSFPGGFTCTPCEHSEIKGVIGTGETVDSWTGVTKFEVNRPCCCKKIQAVCLDWESVDHSLINQLSYSDVILAADVVYDTRIIPALVSILNLFLCNQATQPEAYIASTIRNEETRDEFLVALSNEGLKYEVMDPPAIQLFHYDKSVPIEIISVKAQV